MAKHMLLRSTIKSAYKQKFLNLLILTVVLKPILRGRNREAKISGPHFQKHPNPEKCLIFFFFSPTSIVFEQYLRGSLHFDSSGPPHSEAGTALHIKL